ncbi:MAG: hypothetical protein NWS63_00665 [Saprospiraceae bacterium]|nr:hypothetical protein [Saprospiraceae bacterium]
MKIQRTFGLLLAILFAVTGQAQQVDMSKLAGMKARNIGPAGMSGRITAIDAVVSNPDIIYAGAASGGLWKSESGGTSWTPIFDDQDNQSIGAIAINQNNPSEIWVGTGEGNPRNSHNSGIGIFKSLDGGKTWMHLGLKETKTIHRIIIHPDNPDVVFVGAMGSIWGPNAERGVYKTTDGGQSWEKILYVNDQTGVADLVIDPQNPNKLIAAMWEYGRKPWTFNSGGPGSGIYITHDGGKTWTQRTAKDGLPEGELGRAGLAIAPSKPNVVYALLEAKKNAFYRSTDGGATWVMMNDKDEIGNRPFYYYDIFVDPLNENRVYTIHSGMGKSEDGGKSFQNFGNRDIHPDHHAFWINPNNPLHIIEGNDGGLYITKDGGEKWTFAENIPVGQFYHVNYDMSIPYNVGGGMQDNGSWVGPSSVWRSGGIRNADWQEVYFGDGFDVGFQPDDSRYIYAMSQGGNVGRVDTKTGQTQNIKPIHPEGVKLRFNWNAAFVQNPFHASGIYYGSQFVHKSMDHGQSWEIISPDLTTNDPEKQKQYESGGLTIDNTQAENHTTILAIEPSPLDQNVIWVGTDDGNLQLTRDGGKTWTNLASKLPGAKAGSWIPQIVASAKNPGEALIVVNDYRRNDFRPMAFHTSNFGATFTSIINPAQVDCYTLSIVQDPEVEDILWLGTDCGLYLSIDKGKNWSKWTHGYPAVPTADLKIHSRDHDLIIATFGRSFYVLDDIRPIRELARSKGKVLDEPFRVFAAPDAWLAESRSYEGTRFIGDAIYDASNKSADAHITLWYNPSDKDKKAEEAQEESFMGWGRGNAGSGSGKYNAKVQVKDASGNIVRTFTARIDSGLNRISWRLEMDGVRFPSFQDSRPGSNLPGGVQVLPGTYNLVFSIDDYKDSTTVTVHTDPRIQVSKADLEAKLAAYQAFAKVVETATQGFDQLKQAKKTIALVNQAIRQAETDLSAADKKALTDMGKSMDEKIATLQKLYMDPPGQKGINRTPGLLNGSLMTAFSYLRSSTGAPGQSAQIAMEQAKSQLADTIEQLNAFLTGEFKTYTDKVQATRFTLAKTPTAISSN